MKKEEIEKRKSSSAELSIYEGSASTIPTNIADTYVPQLALILKANTLQIGYLSAFSGLLSPLAQAYGTRLLEKDHRKTTMLYSSLFQVLLLIIIAGVALSAWKGYFPENMLLSILILSYTAIAIAYGISYPAWFSWLGDLIPEHQRGKYFGRRNKIVTLVGLLIVVAGFVLDKMETGGLLLLGFSIFFALSAFFKLISCFLIKSQYEPGYYLKERDFFSFFSFIQRFDGVGKFAVYNSLFNLVMMIASPFFAVYMKEEMHLSYLMITIISLSSSVYYILFAPLIGKFSDKYGNVRLFYIGTTLLALNPLLWMVIKSPIALIFIPQLIVGLSNAAISISTTNFMYNMVSKEKRPVCISYNNILVGIGIFIGSLAGGLLIKIAPEIGILSPFMLAFLVSGILRLVVAQFFISHLKEEEKVERLPIRISLLHPLRTLESEVTLIKKLSK